MIRTSGIFSLLILSVNLALGLCGCSQERLSGMAIADSSATTQGASGAVTSTPTPTPTSTLAPSPTQTPVTHPTATASPSSTATPVSSCTQVPFNQNTSGPSQSTVAPGGTFTLSCDYGSQAFQTPDIGQVSSSANCQWTGWNGTAAVFSCTAPTAPGTYSLSCTLTGDSTHHFCSETNSVSTITVIATTPVSTPSPTPTPTPSGAPPNSFTMTSSSYSFLFTAGDIGHPQADNPPGVVMTGPTTFDWFFVSWGGQYFTMLNGPSTQPTQSTISDQDSSSQNPSWINLGSTQPDPWIMATYKDSDGTIYALVHHELRGPNNNPIFASRLSIAFSTDGKSWIDQGYIIVQYNEAQMLASGNPTIIQGNGMVVQSDGYMYIWYDDDGQAATARALMTDVRAGNVGNWYKYYTGTTLNGSHYSQPGLGGQATPLNVDLINWSPAVNYNTYLNQYIVADGSWTSSEDWGGPLTIYISPDGINWNKSIVITNDTTGGDHLYGVITSPGYKEGTSGQNFDVTYWDTAAFPSSAPGSPNDSRYVRHITINPN